MAQTKQVHTPTPLMEWIGKELSEANHNRDHARYGSTIAFMNGQNLTHEQKEWCRSFNDYFIDKKGII